MASLAPKLHRACVLAICGGVGAVAVISDFSSSVFDLSKVGNWLIYISKRSDFRVWIIRGWIKIDLG
jgi:hypothetical protein